jgi:hypothetical protein
VLAAFLSLIVCAAIIAGVYLDLDHAIKDGNQAQLQYRLILLTVLMSFPGVIIAFLLGFSVRLVTNPKTNWLLPSILVGAGVGITFRAVANKIQSAEKPRIRVALPSASPKQAEPLPPSKEATALDEPKTAPIGAVKESEGSLAEPGQKARIRLKQLVSTLKNSAYHDNHREP